MYGNVTRAVHAALAFVASAAFASAAIAAEAPRGDLHKNEPQAAEVRGGIVFRTYCVLCHGATGEGNGRAAKLYTPKPANLVTSTNNDEYKELIVRRGGAAVGRSPFMPPWGDQLSDEQVRDLVAYLHAISQNKP